MEQAEKRPFTPKAKLAWSAAHHKAVGSTGQNQSDRIEDLHRPLHEFKTDIELAELVQGEIKCVQGILSERDDTDGSWCSHYRQLRNRFLFANLRYLDAIGRLPLGVDIELLAKELPDI